MALKSLSKYINIKRKKEATAEEKQQAIQLTHYMVNEMRSILMNAYLINEMFSKAEQHIFEEKKILALNTFEYESLYEMLDAITEKSTLVVKTLDRVLFLLGSL